MNSTKNDELAQAIQVQHACSAEFKREEFVDVAFAGATGWDGKVSVYSVDHLDAGTCYAWSMPFDASRLPWSTDESGPRAVFAILHRSAVDGPAAAVREARESLMALESGKGDPTVQPVHRR